jgi:hypothetical protein
MSHRSRAITTRLVAEIALYEPQSTTGGGGGITQLTGQVLAGPGVGSVPATVVEINGATVPVAGALVPGDVLTVTGVASLAYLPPVISSAFDVVTPVVNADAPVTSSATQNVLMVLSGLAANHTLTMPAAPNVGQRFGFVDGDGSLSSGFTWSIAGNGNTINGLATFVIAAGSIGASPGGGVGPRGSIWLEWTGIEYKVVS